MEFTFQDIEIEIIHLYSTKALDIFIMKTSCAMGLHIPNIVRGIIQNREARGTRDQVICLKSMNG